MSEDADLEAVAALLDDDCVRCILVHAREEPMSANELAQRCDASGPTVYRRLADLREQDLIDERTRLDEDGHHHKVYLAILDRITVEVTGDGFDVRVDRRREPMADRFTRLIEEM